jgi:ketosteroid isomerase-like protein
MLDQGTYRGHDGIRAYVASLREVWGDSLRSFPESFVEHGDCVVVMARTSVKGMTSGVAIDAHVGHVWTIRAGKIARFQTFARHDEALEAAGLRE